MRQIRFLLFSICVFLLLGSCGAKKKVLVSRDNGFSLENTSLSNKTNVKERYANVLNANPKKLNESLYKFIDEWMGSPHRLGGNTKEGVDCSGFVGMIYRQVYQKNLPRTSSDMADVIKRKYDDQLQEGDLVFFSFGGKSIDHVGIYLHNDKFVHVSTKQGVIISNLKDAWYYKYFTRCGTPQI